MKLWSGSFETDADAEHFWVAAVPDEQIDNPMLTTLSENKRAKYGSNANVMITIVKVNIRALISEQVVFIFAKRTYVEVQLQIEETFVDMLQVCNNAAPNEIKTASARLLETILIDLFSRGPADAFMLKFLEQSHTFLSAVIRRTVSYPLFIRRGSGPIK